MTSTRGPAGVDVMVAAVGWGVATVVAGAGSDSLVYVRTKSGDPRYQPSAAIRTSSAAAPPIRTGCPAKNAATGTISPHDGAGAGDRVPRRPQAFRSAA